MSTYLHLFHQSPSLVFSSQGKFWGWVFTGFAILITLTVCFALAGFMDEIDNAVHAEFESNGSYSNKENILYRLRHGVALLIVLCIGAATYGNWRLADNNYGLTPREARYRTTAIQKAHREYPYVVTIAIGNQANGKTTTHHYLTRNRPKHGAFYAYRIKCVDPTDPFKNHPDNKAGEQIKFQTIGERTLPITAQHVSVQDSTSYLKHKLQKTTDWMRKGVK